MRQLLCIKLSIVTRYLPSTPFRTGPRFGCSRFAISTFHQPCAMSDDAGRLSPKGVYDIRCSTLFARPERTENQRRQLPH